VDEKALIDLLLRSEVQTTLPSESAGDEDEADDEDSEQ
jgi:hypothetical protein